MKDFVPSNIAQYAEDHTTPPSNILQQLYRETHLKVVRPRNISGSLEGAFLRMISQMIRPKCILEVGTYTGYASICLAEGLAEESVLHTIEINEEQEDRIEHAHTHTHKSCPGGGRQVVVVVDRTGQRRPRVMMSSLPCALSWRQRIRVEWKSKVRVVKVSNDTSVRGTS